MTGQEPSRKRFVLDSMLGKVAKWLRVLGFDTRYCHLQRQDQLQAFQARGFLVVTRNRHWCRLTGVICLTTNNPVEQLQELVARASLRAGEMRLFHRCIRCNEPLEPLQRRQVSGRVPDYVYETQATFYGCPGCQRVYWPGSHPQRMLERLQQVLGWNPQDSDHDNTNPTEDEQP